MLTLIDISLLNCCTYSCDYCISKASLAKAAQFTMAEGFIRNIYATCGITLKPLPLLCFIRNHFTPDECVVQLSGGEPTLHDAFPYIAKALIENGYQLVINTNGSQIRSLGKSFDISFTEGNRWKRVKWRASWHAPYRTLDKFLEDIEPLPREDVLINYIALPRFIESGEIGSYISELDNSGYKYEVTPFDGSWDGRDFNKTSKIYEPWITALKPESKFPAIDINYLSIHPNGNIMRCHKAKVGNVYENSLRERYSQIKSFCVFNRNGNTSCGLLQSLYMLNVIIEGMESPECLMAAK